MESSRLDVALRDALIPRSPDERARVPTAISSAIAALNCPFPAAVHPNADEAQRASLRWLTKFNFGVGDSAYRHARTDDFSLLVSRWYANASAEDYQIISDFHVALYILDDVCDEHVVGRDPGPLTELHDRILAILNEAEPQPSDLPLVHAFADVQKRMRSRMSRFWMNRLIFDVQAYFEATLWEAKSRLEGRTPTTAEYVQMRAYTSAVDVYLDLIEFAEGFELPIRVRTHPLVKQIALQTNNIICWCNDILSQSKESEQGDVNNIIFTFQRDGQSLEEAIQSAVRLHNQQVALFEDACGRLPSFGPDIDAMLRRYICGMEWMIRGNLDWSVSITKRFGFAPTAMAMC